MRIPYSADTSQQFIEIPTGAAGTRATLKIMARLVRETRANPAMRQKAVSLVSDLEAKNYKAEIDSIFCFVRDSIRYIQDTNGMEVVQNPLVTLDFQCGDCDDKSTLLAALLESIGHPCRFVAVGYTRPNDFEHVFVETRLGAEWYPLETTMIVEPGWAPLYPNVPEPTTCYMRAYI